MEREEEGGGGSCCGLMVSSKGRKSMEAIRLGTIREAAMEGRREGGKECLYLVGERFAWLASWPHPERGGRGGRR